MNTRYNCGVCGDYNCVVERTQSHTITPLFSKVGEVYVMFKESFCHECNAIYATIEQLDFNVQCVRDAVREKENRVNRQTFLQRLAGADAGQEEVPDFGAALGAGKYYH